MNADIVARLRLRPTILRKNRFGDMETDRAATALFDDCHAIMREAADEIERLRAEVERLRAGGCARDQTTTQFCAEAERLRDRCNRLLHQLQEFEAREAQ
jgi:cell division septum initiation protein DivIVA